MAVQLSWPAILTFTTVVASLYLLREIWPYRSEASGRLFIGVVVGVTFTSFFNALGLVVTGAPVLREALEIAFWAAFGIQGLFWLSFGFVYTGRNRLIGPRTKVVISLMIGGLLLLLVTNPLHHLYWEDFEVVTTLGAAGATYTLGPGLLAYYAGAVFIIWVPVVLLVETLLSYGPLYRSQAWALAPSTLLIWVAMTAYVFELGPVPSLNLIGLSHLPHVILDAYALFYGDMFVFNPSTRRIGETAAIDEVGNPVFVTDTDARVITLNDTAAERFSIDTEDVLGESIETVIGGDSLAPPDAGDSATLRTAGAWREYDITTTPLEDESERTVGYTVTLNDVTAERQRQQRLEVFNRILRHNLRNDLDVVTGALETAETRIDNDEVVNLLQNAEDISENLVSLGNRARRLDRLFDGDSGSREVLQVEQVLAGVAEELRTKYPAASVTIQDETKRQIRTHRELLEEALREAAENGIEHNDSDEPTVRLSASRDGDITTITVQDNGPGLPSHERAVIDRGDETELSHGSGLGLWSMAWCIRRLGGDIEFDVEEGTTVRFELPARSSDTPL